MGTKSPKRRADGQVGARLIDGNKLDEPSLSKLVRDHEDAKLERICAKDTCHINRSDFEMIAGG